MSCFCAALTGSGSFGDWLAANRWAILALVPVGYLVGSVPVGVILARSHGVDLRKVGSGNVGATNVGRALGAGWGYLCFFLDLAKGLAASLLAGAVAGADAGLPPQLSQSVQVGVGCAAVAGHVFNPWLGFRGGKGVATSLGMVLGIYPAMTWAGLCALGIWIVVTMASRYVSLGSIVAAVVFLPLFAAFNWGRLMDRWPTGIFAAAMVALILIRHRGNVRRLLNGTENKIGRKR